MAAPAPVEMPAVRLRKGDLLPTYGPNAAVHRNPVISVDGAMVNVLVADRSDAGAQPQLARIPVGLPLPVIRDTTVQDPFVRTTKVAKSSGARIAVLDLLHPDSEIAAEPGEKFATLCTVHHTVKTHTGISTAHAQASHPEQWCAGCAASAHDLARQRVWGTTGSAGSTGGAASGASA